jgi:hypothetical protein
VLDGDEPDPLLLRQLASALGLHLDPADHMTNRYPDLPRRARVVVGSVAAFRVTSMQSVDVGRASLTGRAGPRSPQHAGGPPSAVTPPGDCRCHTWASP